MQRWRRRISYLLLVYCAGMLLWASRPWTDTQRLATPPEVAEKVFAEYDCPSAFSGRPDDPQPNEPVQYPPADRPCGEQTSHRVLFLVDLAAAAVGFGLLQRSMGRYRAAQAAEDRAAEVAAPA